MSVNSKCPKCKFACICDPCCQCGWDKALAYTGPSEEEDDMSFMVNGVYYQPQTQKAKGMVALSNDVGNKINVWGVFPVSVPAPILAGSSMEAQLKAGQVFARPCPPNPEHGFVESRVVNSLEELEALRQEVLAVCPEGEIMLTGLIKADMNAIWTPTMLTFGKGHDGATAGKNTCSIPLAGIMPTALTSCLPKAGMKEGAAPYIEAVSTGSSWYLTQLRGGPALEAGLDLDFVPKGTRVREIRKTNGEDLLEWAKVIRGIKALPPRKRKGIVVYHPGGSLLDHYSVHCRENGVPIMITQEPVVGKIIRATKKIDTLDPHAMLEGLATVDMLNLYKTEPPYNKNISPSYVHLALLALHNSGAIRGSNSFWIGVGVGAIIKLGVGALEAEARHAHSLPMGMKNKPDIYGYYAGRNYSYLRARLSRVTQLLHYGWGENGEKGNTGFGGIKWALCGAALVPLFNGIRQLVNKPTSENASELLLALNIAINQAHNGGWWLNKFTSVEAYDRIPKGDLRFVLTVGQAMEEAASNRALAVEKHLPKMIRQVSSWPETEIKPLKWRKVDLEIRAGSFVLNLKAATVPNKRQIIIPTTSAFMKSILSAAGGAIEIDNRVINIVTPQGEKINVWNEKPLAIEARTINKS